MSTFVRDSVTAAERLWPKPAARGTWDIFVTFEFTGDARSGPTSCTATALATDEGAHHGRRVHELPATVDTTDLADVARSAGQPGSDRFTARSQERALVALYGLLVEAHAARVAADA